MAEAMQPLAPAWFDPAALVDLIDELRAAGYNIDLTHYMAAQDLLLALAARGVTLDPPQRLQGLLRPLLCSSPAEQAEFPHHFDRWAYRLSHPADSMILVTPTGDLEQELMAIDWQARWARWVLIGIYLLLLSSLLRTSHLPIPRLVPILTPVDIVNAPLNPVEPTIEEAPDPTLFGQVVRVLWRWQTLAAILLLLTPLLAWSLWLLYRAHQFLARHATTQTPELEKVVVQSSDTAIFSPLALFRLAQVLRRRVQIPSHELDIEAALSATIQHVGWFTPVYGRRQVVPEYLILVDRAHYHDHQARLVEELVKRLRVYEVLITLYAFDGDPRISFPLAGKGAPLTLRDLATKHPDQRLILFADASSFFSPFTGALEPWLAQLARWPERALLTPEVTTNWGYREQELAEQFSVLPATPAGLAQLVQSFTQPILATAADDVPQARFPEVLRTRPLRWLERQPPAAAVVETLMADLHTYLDEAGFTWLCACAVYPAIDWNLTLYLGHALQTDVELPYLEPNRLLTLTRLPWLRYGYMPDWLRGQLLKSLPRPQERAVRFALQTLLLTAVQGTPVGFPLEIARRHRRSLSRLARPLLSLLVRKADEDSSLRDYVFLNFMVGRKRPSLALHLPENLGMRRKITPSTAPTGFGNSSRAGWGSLFSLRPLFAMIVHQQERFVKLYSLFKRSTQLGKKWISQAKAHTTWFVEIISPTDIPEHLATSWAGRFIYIVRKLTDSIRPEHLWTLLVWLILWVATNWLVTPILRWPLDNITERSRAALLYALATLVIPFFVALVSPVDRQAEMQLESRRDWARFWFLKLLGAATGFALAAGTIGVAMMAYYLGGSLPRSIQWALTLVPLLFSQIGARRIPGDRLKLYGEVRPHEVDRLVVVVWLLLGPGTAAGVYWGYTTIANPAIGFAVLSVLSIFLFRGLQKLLGDSPNHPLLQELVNVLTPYMATEQERQAKLRLALPNAAYQQINFHGPAGVFTANMVNTLLQYGEDAQGKQTIIAVLDVIHDQVGGNKQRDIDQLRQRLLAHFQPASWVACSRCGVSNRTNAKFCRGCGKTLSVIPQSGTNALPKLAFQRVVAPSWVMISGGIIVLMALIWVSWPLIGRNNNPTSSSQPFTYAVTVKDEASGQPIHSAEVRIEVIGQAPQAEYTDNNGYTRIFISAEMAEQPARLTVAADNYTTATYNIDLWPERLPDEMRLALSGLPSATATLASAPAGATASPVVLATNTSPANPGTTAAAPTTPTPGSGSAPFVLFSGDPRANNPLLCRGFRSDCNFASCDSFVKLIEGPGCLEGEDSRIVPGLYEVALEGSGSMIAGRMGGGTDLFPVPVDGIPLTLSDSYTFCWSGWQSSTQPFGILLVNQTQLPNRVDHVEIRYLRPDC